MLPSHCLPPRLDVYYREEAAVYSKVYNVCKTGAGGKAGGSSATTKAGIIKMKAFKSMYINIQPALINTHLYLSPLQTGRTYLSLYFLGHNYRIDNVFFLRTKKRFQKHSITIRLVFLKNNDTTAPKRSECLMIFNNSRTPVLQFLHSVAVLDRIAVLNNVSLAT